MKKAKSSLSTIIACILTVSMSIQVMAADEQLTQTFYFEDTQQGQLTQTFDFQKPSLLSDTSSNTQVTSKEETVQINKLNETERYLDFDENWRFHMGEANNAQDASFDDSSWKNIDLPHDYSIEQEFTSSGEAESGYLLGGTGWYRKNFTLPESMRNKKIVIDFDGAYMNATVWLNGTKLGTHPYGYTSFAFELPSELLNFGSNNVIAVQTINNVPTSRWYSGSGIYRDVNLVITNPIHVSRYGTAVTTPNLETEKGGDVTVNISTQVENQSGTDIKAVLKHTVYKGDDLETPVSDVKETTMVDIPAGESRTINNNTAPLKVNNPDLWDIEQGNMYAVKTEVVVNDEIMDTYYTDFAFRYFSFDANTGFSLNGNKVKLKGVCMHHDQGALGSEAWYRAAERQVEILLKMGCNSIRVTHNPASSDLIDICNKKGMLVIDEAFDTWLYPKNGNINDYSVWYKEPIEEGNTIIGGTPGTMTWAEFDLKTMVNRGKNAPSIIMWSLGNEVMEGISGSVATYPDVIKELITWAREVDTTRPVTLGDNKLKENWSEAIGMGNALADVGGIVGYNYATSGDLTKAHKNYPDWNIVASETVSAVNSRGVYDRKGNANESASQTKDGLLTAYDKSAVGWGATASKGWYATIINDFCSGEYVWTGFDYIGEPTPWNGVGSGAVGNWSISPKSSFFGIIETTGFAKDSYYFYQSQWNDNVNTLHMLPTWNEEGLVKDENGNIEVVVYSDAAAVELQFTDANTGAVTTFEKKTFTKKTTDAGYTYQIYEGADAYKDGKLHKNLYLTWNVPFAEGTLKAIAYDESGNVINNTEGRSSVTTAGEAKTLSLSADRSSIKADGKDLSYITIDVLDENGLFVNEAEPSIKLDITGNGEIIGVDNGKQSDHTSFQSTTRNAAKGKLLAIVKSTKESGSFTVTASSNGLAQGSVTVNTTAVPITPDTNQKVKSYTMVRNYYVKLGQNPELPSTVTLNYMDGTTGTANIIWDEISSDKISTVGNFVVNGTVEGEALSVSVNIYMLDNVVALLNYSTGAVLGSTVTLPSTRPAVMENGEILSAQFPVTWEDIPSNITESAGTVNIKGVANVFGKAIEVISSVRVSDETITLGGNVAKNASELTADEASVDIENIRDGSTSGSAWTGNGNVSFRYDTAQNIGQVKLYFSGAVPAENETTLLWSPDGTNWNEIYAVAEDTESTSGITERKYTLSSLVPAVHFRLSFSKEVTLLESELIVGTSAFELNDSDELTAMNVNGIDVDSYFLDQREYTTPAYFAKELTVGSDVNASYTILPMYENIVRILTESEDHLTRGTYVIIFRSVNAQSPTDDTNDYDYTKTTAKAASAQPVSGNEGPVEFVIDNKINTHWHTGWNDYLDDRPEDRWIQLTLEEETILDALRYKPRAGADNGTILTYRIDVSTDESNWTTVAQGDWARTSAWKLALFDEEVSAKYIRLYGESTYSTTGLNRFVSAAEIRLRKVSSNIKNISQAEITLPSEIKYTGESIEPKPIVKLDGQELEYGIDYTVSYKDNLEIGTATVTATGIGFYIGEVKGSFEIVPEGSEEATTYTVNFNSTGGSSVSSITVDEGSTVNLPTTTMDGYKFIGWFTEETGGTQYTNTTAITSDVTLYAHWKKNSSDNNSSSGGSGGGGNSGSVVTKKDNDDKNKNNTSSPSVITISSVQTDENGVASVTDNSIKEAIQTAKKDTTKKEFFIKIPVNTKEGQLYSNVVMGAEAFKNIIDEKVTSLEVSIKNQVSCIFDLKSLQQISNQSENKNIVISVEKQTTLPLQIKSIIAERPVYDIKIFADDNKIAITDLNGQKVKIKLPYTPAKGEDINLLSAVYIDEAGNLEWINGSYYDNTEKAIVFETNHFSMYGVALKEKSKEDTVFSDISSHWAKVDIEFMAQRGILSGTAENIFSPDISMTRGMFVTALGRLANADISSYKTSSFSDVNEGSYYMGYIEWANKNGIVTGIGDGQFAPDKAVTRQEMAVIITNYVKAMNYTMAETNIEKAFIDNNAIASWAKEAVSNMHKSGIISGRNDNSFDPQGTATRAEVSSVLHRFIKQIEAN